MHGLKRRSSLFNTPRIDHLYEDPHVPERKLILHHGDMTDSMSVLRVVEESQPDEIYNLAAKLLANMPKPKKGASIVNGCRNPLKNGGEG